MRMDTWGSTAVLQLRAASSGGSEVRACWLCCELISEGPMAHSSEQETIIGKVRSADEVKYLSEDLDLKSPKSWYIVQCYPVTLTLIS